MAALLGAAWSGAAVPLRASRAARAASGPAASGASAATCVAPAPLHAPRAIALCLAGVVAVRSARRLLAPAPGGRSRRWRRGGLARAAQGLQKLVLEDAPTEHLCRELEEGEICEVSYDCKLEDGTVLAKTKFARFELGACEVIDGLDILASTMRQGEVARCIVPPEYAYGAKGLGSSIPPNATLMYDVTMIRTFPKRAETGAGSAADEVDAAAEEKEAVPAADQAKPVPFWHKPDEARESGSGPGYAWQASGSGHEICISIPIDDDITARQLEIDLRTFSLNCKVKGKLIVEGKLWSEIIMDESSWDLGSKDGQSFLLLYLAKLKRSQRWDALLKGKPAVIEG